MLTRKILTFGDGHREERILLHKEIGMPCVRNVSVAAFLGLRKKSLDMIQ